MKQNNKTINIPSGDPKIIEKVINDFNSRYKTDFSIKSVENWDGVEFVTINSNSTTLTDIYLLGFYHGMEIQELRARGKVDWWFFTRAKLLTGALKGDKTKPFVKTLYDPAVWSDAKLEKALKEALQDVVNKNNGVIPEKFIGNSTEGYPIEGYYRNGAVDTFYFK